MSPSQGGISESWLLEALADGVLLVGPDWRVLYANGAAERLLRFTSAELVGKVLGKDVPEPPPERMAIYREVMEKREVRYIRDVVIALEGGEQRLFEGEVHPSPTGGIALVFRDITERRSSEQAATRLGRILESSWHEIYIYDAGTLRFIQVSAGARENLGYSMEELREMTPVDLRPEHSPETFERLVAPLRRGERTQMMFETVHRRKNLCLYPVEVRLQLDHQEGVFISVVLDITERKAAQEQLEAQAIELGTLNEELRSQASRLAAALASRERFYATMSHELRTPINAVIGYNDLILAAVYGPVNEQQRTGVERSQRAARHLMEIVSDVLDISRLEAGKVGIHAETVDLRTLLDDLMVTAQPLSEQYGGEFQLDIEECPATIATDPRRVRQVLLNLLSNAAKFGNARRVDIRGSATEDGGIAIEVEDRGPGIAPADQERIFEEFVQLDASDASLGTGLGLPISRRLAELLGGSLTLRSTPGEGSVFRLELPPAYVPAARVTGRTGERAKGSGPAEGALQ